jgi:hypothetical protein
MATNMLEGGAFSFCSSLGAASCFDAATGAFSLCSSGAVSRFDFLLDFIRRISPNNEVIGS